MEIIPAIIMIITYIFLIIFGIAALGFLYWCLCGDIIARKIQIRKAKSRE